MQRSAVLCWEPHVGELAGHEAGIAMCFVPGLESHPLARTSRAPSNSCHAIGTVGPELPHCPHRIKYIPYYIHSLYRRKVKNTRGMEGYRSQAI